jgi:hypothetical protein
MRRALLLTATADDYEGAFLRFVGEAVVALAGEWVGAGLVDDDLAE